MHLVTYKYIKLNNFMIKWKGEKVGKKKLCVISIVRLSPHDNEYMNKRV